MSRSKPVGPKDYAKAPQSMQLLNTAILLGMITLYTFAPMFFGLWALVPMVCYTEMHLGLDVLFSNAMAVNSYVLGKNGYPFWGMTGLIRLNIYCVVTIPTCILMTFLGSGTLVNGSEAAPRLDALCLASAASSFVVVEILFTIGHWALHHLPSMAHLHKVSLARSPLRFLLPDPDPKRFSRMSTPDPFN